MAGKKALVDLAKSIMAGEEPGKTVSAYKLFRQKNDQLYPLFVNANTPVPMGQWLDAESGPLIGGKVKSSLGPLAYRPGWHAGDLPIATHIGGKSAPGLKAPDYRPDNQVWAEISMPDDVDWQTEALRRAQLNKRGEIIPRTAHITDQIPVGGHYRYKTNPNMTGDWLIGGSMKVNRILPDEEVRDINEGSGVSDLPRLYELMRSREGRARGGSLIQDRFPTHYLPGVGRQVMADGGAAPSMDNLMSAVNSVFTRRPAQFSAADMIGTPTSPFVSGPGAYTDAGGQEIAAPFVTGLKNGYPVPPGFMTPQPNSSTGRRSRGYQWSKGYEKGGVAKVIRAAKDVLAGYSDPPSRYIDDWKWRPLSDVRADIKATSAPPHVRNFGNGNEKTTHQDIIDAMRPRAAGGRAGFADGGWKHQFADVVGAALDAAKNVGKGERINVYHNLDADKIGKLVDRFNAIPAPSLALSKFSGSPVDFGNSTLVGRPHLAIPSEDNHVFGADAYTARMPRIFGANEFIGSDFPKHDFIFRSPDDNTKVPASIENVLAHMRSRPVLGGEGIAVGPGLLKAFMTPQPKTLRDIQRNRWNFADDVDSEDEAWGNVNSRILSHAHLMKKYAREKDPSPTGQLTRAMIDYHREGVPGFERTYTEYPRENMSVVNSIMDDIKGLKPSYMEAKPMRPVGFDEFAGAILPNEDVGYSAYKALKSAGVPEEGLYFYRTPQERKSIMKEIFAPQFGFAGGGSVERAMDIVRNAEIEPREMEPTQGEMDRIRDMMQQSHLSGGPGVVEMRDASYPLPGGRSIPLGRYPKSAVDAVETVSPLIASAAQIAANMHPATRGASRLLDLALRAKFANDVRTTGHGDASDFFSMLPGAKADMMGYAAAFANDPHEPVRDVFHRMRSGYDAGGSAKARAAKEIAKFISLDEARRRVSSPFSDDPDSVARALQYVNTLKVPQGNVMTPGSFYNIKQTRPVSDVTSTVSSIPGVNPLTPRDMTWEDFVREAKGGTLFNVAGDRSDLGRLTHINGRELAWPVDLHAGPKYMLEPNPGAIWANNEGHATGFWNAIREAAKRGPVFGVYHPMGVQSVDSSHNMLDTLLSQIALGEAYKKDMRNADKILRAGAHAAPADMELAREAMKGWPGFENAREASEFARGLEGTRRSEIVKFLDKAPRLREGFPAVGETRVAITDPALRSAPGNMLGHRIVQFDPDNLTPEALAFRHSTHPSPTGGRYVGDVPFVQSQYVMPDVERNIMTNLAKGNRVVHPFSDDSLGRSSWRKSMETRKLGQEINDQMLDSVMTGMQRHTDYGFRKGGPVVKLARDVLSRKRDAA